MSVMMRPQVLFALLASFFFITVSIAASINLSAFEEVHNTGAWLRGDRSNPSLTLHLQIVLEQPNVEVFEQIVRDISTPGHEKYGKHLSRAEIRDLAQPSHDSVSIVRTWLKQNAVDLLKIEYSEGDDIIHLRIAVEEAEELLNTTFYSYRNQDQAITRAESYSLPTILHDHVITVMPIIRFPELTPELSMILNSKDTGEQPSSMQYDPEFCDNTIVPACLQGLYEMNNFTAPRETGTILGIAGFLNQTPLMTDLHDFVAAYAWIFPQVFPQWVTTDGGPTLNPKTVGSANTREASLDLQYAASLAPGIPIRFYSTAGVSDAVPDLDSATSGPILNEPYMSLISFLFRLPDEQLPSVLSISYGENEQTIPRSYLRMTCTAMGRLTARGVSIIASSGDSGPGSSCTANDGNNTARFNPVFPASCPWVTSVGGTVGVNPERAAEFSGGGFSEYWPSEPFQNNTIIDYLAILDEQGDPWDGLYSRPPPRGARGYPDVSIQASNYIIRDHGRDVWVSGTSAAAPVFAAMIANLNAVRLSQGLSVLGFLNAWLYNDARPAFNDITEGGSRGCYGKSMYTGQQGTFIENAGWNATVGWDPATGLGTPNWPKLLEIALLREFSENMRGPFDYDEMMGKDNVFSSTLGVEPKPTYGPQPSWDSASWYGISTSSRRTPSVPSTSAAAMFKENGGNDKNLNGADSGTRSSEFSWPRPSAGLPV